MYHSNVFSCATADPRLPGNIVCSNADDVGKWVDGESGEDAEATDIICNCPPLKVKVIIVSFF